MLSKDEGDLGYVEVLVLLELVLERGEELGVDFEHELLQVLDRLLDVLLLDASHLLHLVVPSIDLLNALGTEDEGGSCDVRALVLQQEGVQESDLSQVLSEVEDLVVGGSVGDLAVALKEPVG